MNIKNTSIRFLLYFFIMMILVFSFSCGSGGGGHHDTTEVTQSDLAGTWDIQRLEAGSTNAWGRYTVTINATGTLTFNSCLDSAGSTTCPAGPIVWTINTTTGVITETDNGTATAAHYSMTSNKNLIAGTSSGSSQLFIAQKRVSGITYSNADLQSKNFVTHSLMVGGENKWLHEIGSTDAAGAVTITSSTDPSGTDNTVNHTGLTISVDANGIVSISGTDMSTYKGFLSSDKKTIVGTFTDTGNIYQLMVIQITTGQTGNSTSQVAGTARFHSLQVGVAPAPFWERFTIDITSAGVMSFSEWACSNSSVTGPTGTRTISIGSTGTATVAGSEFHGQLSYDRTFMVGTETWDQGVYGLDVIIINPAGCTTCDSSSSSSSSTGSSSTSSTSTSSTSTGSSSTGSSSTGSSSTGSSSTGSSSTGSSSTGSSSTGSSSTSSSSTSSSSTSSSSGGETWTGTNFTLTEIDDSFIGVCTYTTTGNIKISLTKNGTSVTGTNDLSNLKYNVVGTDDAICVPRVTQCENVATHEIPPGTITATENSGNLNFSSFNLGGCLGDSMSGTGIVSGAVGDIMNGTLTGTTVWGDATVTFTVIKQ